MYNSEDLILFIMSESGYIRKLIHAICLPYLDMFPWELWRRNLLVGVGRHLRGVPKEDHSLAGDLLSQLCQKTRVINALPFSKLRKLLSRGPSSCVFSG